MTIMMLTVFSLLVSIPTAIIIGVMIHQGSDDHADE